MHEYKGRIELIKYVGAQSQTHL